MPFPRQEQPEFQWVDAETLECTFRGHVTGWALRRVVERTRAAVAGSHPRIVVFETTEVTGYAADVRKPGVPWLTDLRALGIEAGYAIAPNAGVRMIGSAIALAAGFRIKFVKTRQEALACVREHKRTRAG